MITLGGKRLQKSLVVFLGILTVVLVGAIAVRTTFQNGNSTNSNSNNASEVMATAKNVKSVNAQEFSRVLEDESEYKLIDLRTESEYISGKIANAELIDYYKMDFESKIEELDKDQPYAIYCNSGNRSASTLSLMRNLGFTNVIELDGGIQNWMIKGYAVNTDEYCQTC